jgi:peptidyl-prolyl cis-trans isomerase A (cyclophilin A)/peptidyl-prolyl cis-trans isomerase B (cyclophilin B)
MRLTQLSQSVFAAHWFWKSVASIHFGCLTLVLAGCTSGDKELPTASLGTEESSVTPVAAAKPQLERPKFNPFPLVEVKTSAGSFTLKLDAEKAPITVNNFLYYVNRGHYNGTLFHEVYRDSIAMGGGFDTKLTPRPTEMSIRNEAHHGQKNLRGTIAMARPSEGIDSATNQFFINLVDNPSLDYVGPEPSQYGYCVFGEVVSGMETVETIGKAEVKRTEKFESTPATPIVIESMSELKKST